MWHSIITVWRNLSGRALNCRTKCHTKFKDRLLKTDADACQESEKGEKRGHSHGLQDWNERESVFFFHLGYRNPLLINPVNLCSCWWEKCIRRPRKIHKEPREGGCTVLSRTYHPCHLRWKPPASCELDEPRQSHTLMERCRGELLRWRGRKKKKWKIFLVVWTAQPHWFLRRDTRVIPTLRRERERKRGCGVVWCGGKQSETERQKRPRRDWEKRKRWWRKWNGKRSSVF